MNIDLNKALALYAITDARPAVELPQAVDLALRGGAAMIQLRRKNISDDELHKLAHKIKHITDAFNAPLIINDNLKIALQVGCAGVHLGPSDQSISEARTLLGPDKIVGATARTLEQAILAEKAGANYLGSGAMFGSATKLDATAMPLETFRNICKAVKIPVVAIGGIDRTNISKLRGSGMSGFAIISGIFRSDNIMQATEHLYNLAMKALQPRPLLFDLFHTLVNVPTDDLHERTVLGVSKHEWSAYAMTEDIYYRRATGIVKEPREIMRELTAQFGRRLSNEALDEMARLRINRFGNSLLDVKTEILSTLRELKRRGHKLCLVSNADAIDIMRWNDSPLQPLFDDAVFSCLVGHAKPEPEIYIKAAGLLDENPGDCVFIGDGGTEELMGAKRMGMQTIQVQHFWPKEVDYADIMLDNFTDLLDCL